MPNEEPRGRALRYLLGILRLSGSEVPNKHLPFASHPLGHESGVSGFFVPPPTPNNPINLFVLLLGRLGIACYTHYLGFLHNLQLPFHFHVRSPLPHKIHLTRILHPTVSFSRQDILKKPLLLLYFLLFVEFELDYK